MFNSRFYGFFILAVLIPNVQISSSSFIADTACSEWGGIGVTFPSNSKSFVLLNSIQLLLDKSKEPVLPDKETTDDIRNDMVTLLELWVAGARGPELKAARKKLKQSVLEGAGRKSLQACLAIIRTQEISEVLADLTEAQIDSLMWLYLKTLTPIEAIVFLLKTVMYNNPKATPIRMVLKFGSLLYDNMNFGKILKFFESFQKMNISVDKKEILNQVSAAIAKEFPDLQSAGIRSCVDNYLKVSGGEVYKDGIPPVNGNVAAPAGVDTNIFVQNTTPLVSIVQEAAGGVTPKFLSDAKILLILDAVELVARKELKAAESQTHPMNGLPVTEKELEILVENACNDQNPKSISYQKIFEAFKGFGMQVMRVVVIDQLARDFARILSKIPAESCKEIVGNFIETCDLNTAFLVIEEMSSKMVKTLIKRSKNMTYDLVKLDFPKSMDLFSLRKSAMLIGKLRNLDPKNWASFLKKVDSRIIPTIFGNCPAEGSTES